jgi:dienelactone hydrolase
VWRTRARKQGHAITYDYLLEEEILKDEQVTPVYENKWGTYSVTHFSSTEESRKVHPAIVFVHGFHAKKEWYSWIGKCLVSQGYSALLLTVPQTKLPNPQQWSDGIKSAVDYLLSKESPVHDTISSEKIGVMGHSMGGLGALIAGSDDPRIKCIVSLAPAILPRRLSIPKEIYNILTPIQLQIGSNDGLIPPENVKTFFKSLNSKQKSYLEIKGGNHIRFLDKTTPSIIGEYLSRFGTLGRWFKDGRASITFEEQHAKSSNGFVEWFNRYLKH